MTKHDHWKTTDVDGEDAAYRSERIEAAFVRKFGGFNNPVSEAEILEGLAYFGTQTIYDLLVAEFDALTPDQQESFLGMDND